VYGLKVTKTAELPLFRARLRRVHWVAGDGLWRYRLPYESTF
jgi:hypothetical protein